MKEIPTISLAAYRAGTLSADEMQQLARACEDHGFFLLADHGADQLVAEVFQTSQGFFAQPKSEKHKIFRDEINPLGYFDRELTKQKRDLKEVFDFKAGGYISSDPAKQTRWPQHSDQFRKTLTEFFQSFTALADETMRMVFTALGMPAEVIAETSAPTGGGGADQSPSGEASQADA